MALPYGRLGPHTDERKDQGSACLRATSDGLAPERQCVEKFGLSAGVIATIQGSRVASTMSSYAT